MKFVLDTNICIYLIKKKPVQVFDKFKELSLGSVGISSITMAELQYGIKKSTRPYKNQIALNQFLLPLEIVDFDTAAAIEYGIIRADLEKKGTPIGSLDTLIAAHVKAMGLILVTNNEKEFIRIDGLKVENWTK
jgi:tRNA(fMet)-specific endonuclease VapC